MADLQQSIARLQAACDNPRAQLDYYLSQGKKVVGCFAPWAPEELVHASGMIPMGMWGGHTELKMAKSYLPAFACSIMQANMEFGLSSKEGVQPLYHGVHLIVCHVILLLSRPVVWESPLIVGRVFAPDHRPHQHRKGVDIRLRDLLLLFAAINIGSCVDIQLHWGHGLPFPDADAKRGGKA